MFSTRRAQVKWNPLSTELRSLGDVQREYFAYLLIGAEMHIRSLLFITVISLGLSEPEDSEAAQSSTTVSAADGTSIALASAADYTVRHGAQWTDYENIMILATLNGAAKQDAATGKQRSTADYLILANTAKDWLDKQQPSAATFLTKDQAGRLRYSTDMLMAITDTIPAVGGIISAAWGGAEKEKIDYLENTLDPRRQAAADQNFYDLGVKGN